eukprot:2437347-Rhodomonas_salina.1
MHVAVYELTVSGYFSWWESEPEAGPFVPGYPGRNGCTDFSLFRSLPPEIKLCRLRPFVYNTQLTTRNWGPVAGPAELVQQAV